MPIVDALFLNPFEKWTRYNRVPWTFGVHFLLLVLVTVQALLLFNRDVQHVSRTARHFAHLFVGSSDSDRPSSVRSEALHSPGQLQDAVNTAVYNHFFINNVSIASFRLLDPSRLNVSVYWRDDDPPRSSIIERRLYEAALHNGTGNHGGPAYLHKALPWLYDLEELPRMAVLSMEHKLDELPGHRRRSDGEVPCLYRWEVQTIFDGSEAGAFFGRVKCFAGDCQAQPWGIIRGLGVSCLLLAVLALVLVLRKFWRSLVIVRTLRNSPEARAQEVSCMDLASLVSPWWAFALVVHTVQIVACRVTLQERPYVGQRFESMGLSCFFTWVNMIQYFESFPAFFMAFHTMSLGAGRVFRYLFSVAPLGAAFIFLGVCLFWQSSMFESPGAAACSLFSLMNGDEIHDTFQELQGVHGYIAHAYLYSFLFVFIFVILNVNITIISDAYEVAKRHPQREGLKKLKQLAEEGRSSAPGDVLPSFNSAASALGMPLAPGGPPSRGNTPPRSPSLGPAVQPAGGSSPSSRRPRTSVPYMSPRFWSSSERIQEALLAAYPDLADSLQRRDSLSSLSLPGAARAAHQPGAQGSDAGAVASASRSLSLPLVLSVAAPVDAPGPEAVAGARLGSSPLLPAAAVAATPAAAAAASELPRADAESQPTDSMELVDVGQGWEEFDGALQDLQAALARLARCQRPESRAPAEFATRLAELQSAAAGVAACRAAGGAAAAQL